MNLFCQFPRKSNCLIRIYNKEILNKYTMCLAADEVVWRKILLEFYILIYKLYMRIGGGELVPK